MKIFIFNNITKDLYTYFVYSMLYMKYECNIVHIKNNEILIRINGCVAIHQKIFDENDKPMGKITRVLGPVSHPYALAYMGNKNENTDKIYVKC